MPHSDPNVTAGFVRVVNGENNATGSKVSVHDEVKSAAYDPPFGSGGTWIWHIPIMYRPVGTTSAGDCFTYVDQEFIIDATGRMTVKKGGDSKSCELNDPSCQGDPDPDL